MIHIDTPTIALTLSEPETFLVSSTRKNSAQVQPTNGNDANNRNVPVTTSKNMANSLPAPSNGQHALELVRLGHATLRGRRRGRGRSRRRGRGRERGRGLGTSAGHTARGNQDDHSQGWNISFSQCVSLKLEQSFARKVIHERARLLWKTLAGKIKLECVVRDIPLKRGGFFILFMNRVLLQLRE